MLFFIRLMLHWEKSVIANDDTDIEDQVVREPKEKKQEDSKEDPLLEDL